MQLTVTDQLTLLEIPLGVSLVEIANTGSATVYRGWERQVQAAPGALQGVPLGAGNQILYPGALHLHGRGNGKDSTRSPRRSALDPGRRHLE